MLRALLLVGLGGLTAAPALADGAAFPTNTPSLTPTEIILPTATETPTEAPTEAVALYPAPEEGIQPGEGGFILAEPSPTPAPQSIFGRQPLAYLGVLFIVIVITLAGLALWFRKRVIQ